MRNFFGNNGNGGGGMNVPGPLGNAMNVMGQFKEFRATPMNAFMG